MNTNLQDRENPQDSFVQSIDVHELLPQQEPFVMISRLEHFDMKRVVTSLEVKPDNIFVEDGHLSASGLIENMAQTCAARIGYINKYVLLKGIQIGFIGALRNFQSSALPAVHQRITTEVEVLEEIFGMVLAQASTFCNGEHIASTEIKIAIKE